MYHRIGCILTYNGNATDTTINYALLVLNLFACASPFFSSRHPVKALASLFFTMCFQVSLCLVVFCSGVSIVWCAMAGWLICEQCNCRQHRGIDSTTPPRSSAATSTSNAPNTSTSVKNMGRIWELSVLVSDFIVIIYYLFTSELITTVAHGCALVLGAILWRMSSSIPPLIPAAATVTSTTLVSTDSSTSPLVSSRSPE